MTATAAKRVIGPVIRLHPEDNVVVARVDVAIGTEVPAENFVSRSQTPAGYKIAVCRIAKGEAIFKYNTTVGFANAHIEPGTMVHSHNTEFGEFARDYAHATQYTSRRHCCPKRSARRSRGMCAPAGRWARATSSASCRP